MRNSKRLVVLVSVALAVTVLFAGCQTVPNTGPDGDAFYTPPSPLPAGGNGDPIWYHYQSVSGHLFDADGYQVLYRSRSTSNAAIQVSGSVLVPTAAYAGPGPRPIVAVAPGSQGMGDSCAPSKHIGDGGYLGASEVGDFLNKGWAVAMTDYEGLGTAGDHTYVIGGAMGHALLDVARAATRMPFTGLSANAPVFLYGFSEGGAGASWAGELAGSYAPEPNIKGVAAGGVPADLTAVAANLEGQFGFGFLMAAAVGFTTAYPELNLQSYLNSAGQTAFADGRTKCTIDLVLSYANRHIADYTTSNPLDNAQWKARLAQNKLGQGHPSVPTFLFRGTTDEFMPLAQALAQRSSYCAQGTKVRWVEYAAGHLDGATKANPDVLSWMADRLAGVTVPNNCP